jgi:glycosyltransferase involved in cell wall biosynthesis
VTPTVAYLTSRMPYPPTSGGQRREYELLKRASESADVHLFVVTQQPDADGALIDEMRRYCTSVTMLEAQPPPVPPAAVPARVWRQSCPEMKQRLASLFESELVDLVHVEGYYMLQHVPDNAQAPIALVEENVEFLLDEQRERLGLGGDASWRDARRLERAAWERADVCGAATLQDVGRIRRLAPGVSVHWCPHGFEHEAFSRPPVAAPGDAGESPVTVTLLGSYSYPPSEDAALFLIAEVWPLVLQRVRGSLRLCIVGADPTQRIRTLAAAECSVDVLGWVPSLDAVYGDADIAVAPIRIGGGVKVKVLEAIAHGCPVVATPLGADGLPPGLRRALAVGADPPELADHIAAYAESPSTRHRAAARARAAADELPSWTEAADRLWRMWQQGLASGQDTQPREVRHG